MDIKVTVEEVAHGGYAVVIRIAAGADRDAAAQIAQGLRGGKLDLRDVEWR